MIPKLIHQTAKTAEIPEQWRGFQQRLRDLHPGWTYKLWTDDDNLAFVRAEFPDFVDTYAGLPKNIMRADVIRYLLMYRLGGLYLDLDFEMLRPFDLTHHRCVLPWESRDDVPPGERIIANASFASEPGHPFWRAILDDLKANPPQAADETQVLYGTGPAYISRIFRDQFLARADELGIYNPPGPLFAPHIPRNRREYDAVVRDGVAYGIHHCHGTWRRLSPFERVKQAITRAVWRRL